MKYIAIIFICLTICSSALTISLRNQEDHCHKHGVDAKKCAADHTCVVVKAVTGPHAKPASCKTKPAAHAHHAKAFLENDVCLKNKSEKACKSKAAIKAKCLYNKIKKVCAHEDSHHHDAHHHEAIHHHAKTAKAFSELEEEEEGKPKNKKTAKKTAIKCSTHSTKAKCVAAKCTPGVHAKTKKFECHETVKKGTAKKGAAAAAAHAKKSAKALFSEVDTHHCKEQHTKVLCEKIHTCHYDEHSKKCEEKKDEHHH